MLEQGQVIPEKEAEGVLVHVGGISWMEDWENISRKSWLSTKKQKSAKVVKKIQLVIL